MNLLFKLKLIIQFTLLLLRSYVANAWVSQDDCQMAFMNLDMSLGWRVEYVATDFSTDKSDLYDFIVKMAADATRPEPLKTINGVTTLEFDIPALDPELPQMGTVFGESITTTNFSLEMETYFQAPMDGEYTFTIEASDGIMFSALTDMSHLCCENIAHPDPNVNPFAGRILTVYIPNDPEHNNNTFTWTMKEGVNYALGLMYCNFAGDAKLKVTVTLPTGETTSNLAGYVGQDTTIHCDYIHTTTRYYSDWNFDSTSTYSSTVATIDMTTTTTLETIYYVVTPTATPSSIVESSISEVPVTSDVSSEILVTSDVSSEVTVTSDMSSEVTVTSDVSSEVPLTSDVSSEATLISDISSQTALISDVSSDVPLASHVSSDVPLASHVSSDVPLASHVSSDVPLASHVSSEVLRTSDVSSEVPLTSDLSSDTALKYDVSSLISSYSSLSSTATFTYSSIDPSSAPQLEPSISVSTEEPKTSATVASSTVTTESSTLKTQSSTVIKSSEVHVTSASAFTTWGSSFLPSWSLSNASFPSSTPAIKSESVSSADLEGPTTSNNVRQEAGSNATPTGSTSIRSTPSSTRVTSTAPQGRDDKTTTATVLSTTTATVCSTCTEEGNGQGAGDRHSNDATIDATDDVVSTTTKDDVIQATVGAAATTTNNHIATNGAATTNAQINGVSTAVNQANTVVQGAATTRNVDSDNTDTAIPVSATSPLPAQASVYTPTTTLQGSTPTLYSPEDSNAAGHTTTSNFLLVFAIFILM